MAEDVYHKDEPTYVPYDEIRDFTNNTDECDISFTIDDRKVYATKAVLSIASSVFRDMFQQNHSSDIELIGIKCEHFIAFLQCIYPDMLQEITDETVYWILPLAYKYQVKNLKAKCEEKICLIVQHTHSKNANELYRHIKLSELYDIKKVETLCLKMASDFSLDELEEANKMHQIAPDTNIKVIKMGFRKLESLKSKLRADIENLLTASYDYKAKSWAGRNVINYIRAMELIHQYFIEDEKLMESAMFTLSRQGLSEVKKLEEYSYLRYDVRTQFEEFCSPH